MQERGERGQMQEREMEMQRKVNEDFKGGSWGVGGGGGRMKPCKSGGERMRGVSCLDGGRWERGREGFPVGGRPSTFYSSSMHRLTFHAHAMVHS